MKGLMQDEIDQAYSHVVDFKTERTALNIAVQYSYFIRQMDV